MDVVVCIGIAAFVVLGIYAIVKTAVERAERRRFRKRNRESQYSGTAVKEKDSFWTRAFYQARKTRAEALGDSGERRMAAYLEDLPCEVYRVYNDILIRDGNYTTQVDHIVISRYGVFVIEMKNIHGKIYGTGKSEYWSQYLPDVGYKRYGYTQKYTVRNPLWQNAGHIRSLRKLVFGNDVPVYGIVVFPTEADLNVSVEQPVLNMWDVVPYIKSIRDVALSEEDMEQYRDRLLQVASREASDREHHLVNIAQNKLRRAERVAAGLCPLCGSKLVLRNGKYGQFWGCSGYPNCSYILRES